MAVSAAAIMEYVRVEKSATFGRILVATSGFPRGRCILEELEPYAYTLLDSKRGLFCDFCLKKCSQDSTLKCPECNYVSYCNEACQKGDWERCHQHHCKTQKRYPDMVRLLSQIFQKQSTPGTQDDKDLFPTTTDQLESHHEKLNHTINNPISSTCKDIVMSWLEYCKEKNILTDQISLLKIYGATLCNNFSIGDDVRHGIAIGIYLRACMVNHSCDPNCVVVFDGRKLQLRTIKDVKEGEECTCSYVNFFNFPTKERQAELYMVYNFTCECVKCGIKEINALKQNDGLAAEVQGLKNAKKQMEDASKSQDWTKLLKQCEPYLKPSCLPADHHLLVAVRAIAFNVRIFRESWKEADEIGQLITQPYKDHYGEYHPTLGVHYLQMGKLQIKLKKLEEARKYFPKAETVLEVTHGNEHSQTKLVKELLNRCRFPEGNLFCLV